MMSRRLVFALFLALTAAVLAGQPEADPLFPAAPPPGVTSPSAVLMDAGTGTILYSRAPSRVIAPASLTKLMTMHLALREIKAGRAEPESIVELPPETWAENQPPRSSLMFLGRGQRVSLGEILMGLAVSSGNDAALAAALHLAPSRESFVAMMNAEAGRLGLASTRFTEPAGISPENTTTAMDFARFCRVYLREHPESPAAFHSRPSFSYPLAANTPGAQPQTILQYNRNTLLERVPGVNGLKTGYITEAGYNIALSGGRDGTHLVAVILGALNEEERDRDGDALLRWGFDNFRTLRFTPDYPGTVRVWGSRERFAPVALEEDPVFTVSARRNNGGRDLPRQRTELDPYLKAPLPARSVVGTLILSDNTGELRRFSLTLEREVPRGNFFRVLLDNIILFFKKRFGHEA